MIAPGQLALVALSGGADSTALLHVLKALGHRLCACHVHHGLRGAEADADARHAAAFAASLGLACVEKRADVKSLAKARKLSLETAAREVRYASWGGRGLGPPHRHGLPMTRPIPTCSPRLPQAAGGDPIGARQDHPPAAGITAPSERMLHQGLSYESLQPRPPLHPEPGAA
jgi:hypothetical protein